jgi:phage tail-like protein
MDANGLRFFQVASPVLWRLDGRATSPALAARNLHWRADTGLVRLASQQTAPDLAENEVRARTLAARPSVVCDRFGGFAWWDSGTATLSASGSGLGAIALDLPPDDPPGVPQPTDLALGTDDVLYVARNDAVVLLDRRDRWPAARVAAPGFAAHRLAPAPDGGVWALDRVAGRIARITGLPLRAGPFAPKNPDVFLPVQPNPSPPRLRIMRRARIPAGHEAVAIACSPAGQLAVLAWRPGTDATVFCRDGDLLVRRFALEGLRFPVSIAWDDEDRIAVLAVDGSALAPQAFVYALDAVTSSDEAARPTGETYPLVGAWSSGFVNAPDNPPRYPIAGAQPDAPAGTRALRRLSRVVYARSGAVTLGPFDGGETGFAWHRLFLEACIPDHAGMRIWALADDDPADPMPPGESGAPAWNLHIAGAAAARADVADAPRAAWLPADSELPFAPALLPCPRQPDRAGVFTLLLQRAGRRVRRLEGRFLWLRVELIGDSHVTPEVAAIRATGRRFAYRDRYLPELYRETLTGPDADATGSSTPSDFLDRFLGLFEGALTELEDKVAGAWLLTDPAAAPAPALPWLGRWIGIDIGEGGDPKRARQALLAAPYTARLHGTLGGLNAAVELETGGRVVTGGRIDPHRAVPRPGELALATTENGVVKALVLAVSEPGTGGPTVVLVGGAVTCGTIVVVEGYRLRRTFATILGADLADENDPLTLGLADSGNSFVGDTLILGDEAQRAFLALFAADLPQSAADRAAVAAFYERLAHRVLVLVRQEDRTVDLRRIAAAAATAAPAHVEASVFAVEQPLIVAASSLVGIDTYLAPPRSPGDVHIDRSRLGMGDLLVGDGRLDRRGETPASALPIAIADGPAVVPPGTGFLLSAARSQAAPGRTIVRNIWLWN